MSRPRITYFSLFALSGAVLAAGASAVVCTATPAARADVSIQALPTPFDFVSNLDLECFDTQGPAMNQALTLTQLNPVLTGVIPPHTVTLLNLAETCTPVAKNNVIPSEPVLSFVQHIDFACYFVNTTALTTPIPLTLRHLNPVLSGLPAHQGRLSKLSRVCVPVGKNGVTPPIPAVTLAQYLDLECWDLLNDPYPTFNVTLSQLNPQLTGIERHPADASASRRRLCVPVRKNQQVIPEEVLNVIRWVDLEQIGFNYSVTSTPVTLHHLNPLLLDKPRENVRLERPTWIAVPVSKNGNTPPNN